MKYLNLLLLFTTLISCSQNNKKETETKVKMETKTNKTNENKNNSIKENERMLFDKGVDNIRKGLFQEAVNNYTEIIKITKSDKLKKMSFIHRGQANERLRKPDLAIEDYTNAIKLDSSDLTSFIDRGIAKLYSKKLESGKKDFKYILENNPNNKIKMKAYYWLAKLNFSKGEFDKAIVNSTKAIEINGNISNIYFIRASSYDRKMDYVSSIKDYTQMIKIKPRDYVGYANRGFAKINQLTTNGKIQPKRKETESACDDLKKAKELGDNTVDDMIFVHCGGIKK